MRALKESLWGAAKPSSVGVPDPACKAEGGRTAAVPLVTTSINSENSPSATGQGRVLTGNDAALRLDVSIQEGYLGNLSRSQFEKLEALCSIFSDRVTRALQQIENVSPAYSEKELILLNQVWLEEPKGSPKAARRVASSDTLLSSSHDQADSSTADPSEVPASPRRDNSLGKQEVVKFSDSAPSINFELHATAVAGPVELPTKEGEFPTECDSAPSAEPTAGSLTDRCPPNRKVVQYEPGRFSELHAFLLRFLRARAFDVPKASLMLSDYLQWREEFRVNLITDLVRFPWVKQLRQLYPHGYHGVDRIGRPIYIERVGRADIAAVLKLTSLQNLMSYWVQQYEYLRQIILPACSIAAGRRIEHSVSILDLAGLGLSHIGAQSRSTMKQLTRISQCYYPETLGCMVIVNAPSVFRPVWSFTKSLIDEVTVQKISLMTSRSSRWREHLQTLANRDQLPEFLGGAGPNQNWDMNERGPWRDVSILNELKKRQAQLCDSFLFFDLNESNPDSVRLLQSQQQHRKLLKPGGESALPHVASEPNLMDEWVSPNLDLDSSGNSEKQ